jgi:hypothetical protein
MNTRCVLSVCVATLVLLMRGISSAQEDCQFLSYLQSGDKPPARPVLLDPELPRETANFVIHFTLSGVDQTTIAWVESIAVSLEHCRSTFVVGGWLPPPPDGGQGGDNRYDVYVVDNARWGDVVPEDPFSDPYTGGYTSWMEIHPDSIPQPFAAFSRLRALLAHELHHAVQLRYRHVMADDRERWFHENTSVYMEDVVYDDVNTLPYRLQFPGPLSDPHVRITTGTRTQYTSWMYGGGLWPTFLDERYGDVLPLLVWARIGSDTTVSYITSTAGILDSIGVQYGEALREYASWRYFTGARAAPGYFHEAGSYPTATTLNPHQAYPEDSSLIGLEAPGGTSFVEFVMGAPGLVLSVDGGQTGTQNLEGNAAPDQAGSCNRHTSA